MKNIHPVEDMKKIHPIEDMKSLHLIESLIKEMMKKLYQVETLKDHKKLVEILHVKIIQPQENHGKMYSKISSTMC